MKKFLLAILMVLAFTVPSYATDYYAGLVGPISADNVWFTTSSGSCTGTTGVSAATALQNGNTLYANGCVGLTITASFTATKISVLAGAGTAGGTFLTVTNTTPITITSAIEAGTTTALGVSGNANANPALTIIGAITGGSASSCYGVGGTHTVGTVVVNGAITGGSYASGYGYYSYATTGAVSITGNVTGATGSGLYANGAQTVSLSGDCIAGVARGCYAGSTGAITVTGNIIASTTDVGAHGRIIWAPSSAQKYIKFNGGGTAIYASSGLGSDAGGTQITGANTAAEIKTTGYFVKKDDGVYTQGTASTGGGSGGSYVF